MQPLHNCKSPTIPMGREILCLRMQDFFLYMMGFFLFQMSALVVLLFLMFVIYYAIPLRFKFFYHFDNFDQTKWLVDFEREAKYFFLVIFILGHFLALSRKK